MAGNNILLSFNNYGNYKETTATPQIYITTVLSKITRGQVI